ncbi:family 43 glycosylhydrolase [Chitinophagaceae bacterium LB-8]|uniref:Family 43 glycosylhydrolase n=1 Tax=Paraflavisolibacter caeni TaxID=2982496 RepID=A0A9X3BIY7_9BACT|nr:family 43 glycosylhydrolase [Paraflavisolibacter caeni]MCU7550643.1 family 43 glycosylhydrolase [Paraflavisolibacter caeni]
MKIIIKTVFVIILLINSLGSSAQKQKGYSAIYSGIPRYDDRGNVVSAHGANIIKDNGRYYLFGEKHSDTSNAFAGFNCYSSTDLYNWKFESLALPVQDTGKLGPNRVGERVKVMKCLATGEYIMYMHVDTLGYKDQFVGYATSKTISGPYSFRGPLLFGGNPIRKWDMGTFQDHDGAGYVLLHGGDIYRLSDDYKSISEQVHKSMTSGFESPAIFRKDSLYYFLGSHLTSWERNDNDYYTATSLKGPWTFRGTFAPKGTLTWNSQTTFVLPIEGSKDTTFMFMGDRWSFPKQASAATYVWQPLTVSGTFLSIPKYVEAWQINSATGVASPVTIGKTTMKSTDKGLIKYSGNWKQDTLSVMSSDEKDASFSLKFKGTQIGFYALSRPNGGYANVRLQNSKGKTVVSSILDMYCKYPAATLKFLSPVLAKDNYTLTVTVMGERGNWSDKRKSDYGSTGYFVSLDKIVINE